MPTKCGGGTYKGSVARRSCEVMVVVGWQLVGGGADMVVRGRWEIPLIFLHIGLNHSIVTVVLSSW